MNVKDGTPMSSLHITQNFTRIFKKHFNKNVGSTLLRHIVLTEKFDKQLQAMEAMAVFGCGGWYSDEYLADHSEGQVQEHQVLWVRV
eukprot:COSAG03_NODE_10204_length_665_cov_1.141343_2_plen_87_part_00